MRSCFLPKHVPRQSARIMSLDKRIHLRPALRWGAAATERDLPEYAIDVRCAIMTTQGLWPSHRQGANAGRMSECRPLGNSGLSVAPLIFGGNVFGWTADRPTSFALLDAFVDSGFNAIDTADFYSRWIDGHEGGESESMIGAWLKANPAKRDRVVILTKVGMNMGEGRSGLSRRWIMQSIDESLRRLRTDVIDLYQAHCFDSHVPQEETLDAFARLIDAGKVRAIGCSNFDATQLGEALAIAARHSLPRYEVVQPRYNLLVRSDFEGALHTLTQAQGIGVIPYSALAGGFLTGKYRTPAQVQGSARRDIVGRYLNARGLAVVAAVETVAARHAADPAAVALAWLRSRPGVTAPIVSATSATQLQRLLAATVLNLQDRDMSELDAASA